VLAGLGQLLENLDNNYEIEGFDEFVGRVGQFFGCRWRLPTASYRLSSSRKAPGAGKDAVAKGQAKDNGHYLDRGDRQHRRRFRCTPRRCTSASWCGGTSSTPKDLVILTSATLRTEETFDYLRER